MEHALLEYLANALWQIPLLAAGAWLLIRATKPGPLMQHYLWLAVLALAILLPARGIESPSPLIAPGDPVATSTTIQTSLVSPIPRINPSAAEPRWLSLPSRVRNVHLTANTGHVLTGLYLAVLLLGLARIAFAWRVTRRLVRRSSRLTLSPRNMEALHDCSHRLRVSLPQLRESSEVSSPVVVGIRSPVMLLPCGFARHADEAVKAALCHELAHLQRRDYLVNLICQVAALPVAWHPATTGVQRRIRRTREMVCDDIAAREMRSGIGYAKCLMALAQSMVRGQIPTEQAQALGLFGTNTLEERVMRLMEKKSVLSLRAKLARAAGGATAMAAAILVAAFFHVTPITAATITQDAPTAPKQEQAQPPAVPAPPAAVPGSLPDPGPVPSAPPSPGTAPPAPAAEPVVDPQPAPEAPDPVIVMDNGERRKLTPAERAMIDKQMAEAREQIAKVQKQLQSGEFQKQIQAAAKQAAEASVQSEQFKKQMAELKARMESGEFKKQIADAAKQAAEASVHSEEFKKQMAELKVRVDSDEFKKQIEDAARQSAQVKIDAEQIKIQMKALQLQLESGELKRQMEQAAKALKDAEEQMKNEKVK